jgi:hypothetical protein
MSLNLGIIASSRSSGISPEAPIVTSGLVAHYDAGNSTSYGGIGSTWNDLSVNALNATLVNSPVFNVLNGGNFIISQVLNNYVTVPHNSLFNFTTGITISVWIKTTKSVDGYIATKGENSFFLCVGPAGTTAGKASLFLQGTGGGWAQSATTVSTGNWVNITATWASNTTRFYINGALDSTNTRSGTSLSTGTSPVYFCWRNVPIMNANISIYMFYNRALNETEVLQNFNARKSRYGL